MGGLDPRIKIRAPLRCDGIGRLDCAEDTESGDRLAVRWLPLEANGHAAVKACEKLPSHPTLPRIHQTGQVGGTAFVALDFPQGELLSARREERLENEVLFRLATQLSEALTLVHAQGVVHGEMSRDSVLMVPGGKASLWDMPLVIANRLSDRRGEERLMQNLVRAAPYLAPERARGGPASQAGDVYALGVILCISGGAPLPTAPTTLGVVHMVASGNWVPRIPTFFPDSWVNIITRMLAVDPSARPGAAEVAQVFAQIHRPSSIATVPEMPVVRLPPSLAARDDLKAAQQEITPAPLASKESIEDDPTPAMEVNTAELEMATAVAPSVAMTDSLLVAPELLADGAVTLAPDYGRPLRSRKPWVILGAVAVAALSLLGLLLTKDVVTSEGPASTSPPESLSTVEESLAPDDSVAPAPSDDLTPLPELGENKKPVAAKATGKAAPPKAAVKTSPAKTTADGLSAKTATAKGPVDLASEPTSQSAHTDELKRPSPEAW